MIAAHPATDGELILPVALRLAERIVFKRIVFAENAKTTPLSNSETASAEVQAGERKDDALGQAARRVRGRALAAQATLFDTVNESLLDELRDVDVENLSSEEIRTLLKNIRTRIV